MRGCDPVRGGDHGGSSEYPFSPTSITCSSEDDFPDPMDAQIVSLRLLDLDVHKHLFGELLFILVRRLMR